MANKFLILAMYKLVTASKISLYRGVQDIMPSEMQKKYIGDGIYGSGMYFAFNYEDAENYMEGIYDELFSRWGIIAEYNFDLGNSIVLSPLNTEGICKSLFDTFTFKKDAKLKLGVAKIEAEKLTDLASKKKFDSIILKGTGYGHEFEGPNGGEQVILLPNSKIKPSLKYINIFFKDVSYANKLGKLIKIKPYHKSVAKIPISSFKKVDAFLKAQNWKDDDYEEEEEY